VPDTLTGLLAHYGALLVAVAMITEGCGIPVPAETVLVTAAALAARGKLSIWAVAAGGALGGIAGGHAGYVIGAKGGMRLVRRFGAKMRIDEAKLDRARKFFARRGGWAVFFCRFIGWVRIFVPMVAGVTHMPLARFAAANAAGAVVSAAAYAALGWFFGRDLPALEHHLTEATLVVVGLVVLWMVVRRIRARRRGAGSSAALLLFVVAGASAGAQQPSASRAARLDTLVVASDDSGQRYAAYLPSTFDPARRWPVLFVLDPRGRARLALELFRPAAERLGVIVLSSYDSRSDTSDADVNLRAMNALLASAQDRYRADVHRLYIAGFSGTARDALRFGLELRGQVAGVIGVGAGGDPPPAMLAGSPDRAAPFAYFAATGTDDFNHVEVRTLAERLEGAHVPVRLAVFDGAHAWPPATVCGEALAWLMLRAMRDGLAAPDSAWIAARLAEELSRAEALDASGRWDDAARLYAAIARDYDMLPSAADAGRRASAIEAREPMRRLRARMAEMTARERGHDVDVKVALLWLRTLRVAPTAAALSARLGVPALARQASSGDSIDAPSARRTLARIGALAAFYEPRGDKGQGDVLKAARVVEVAASIAPLGGEACVQLEELRRRAPRAVAPTLGASCR
jgi:membrane protein DedA with SNARE-associated domain/predicted esterase